jgi:hypothetical protein
VFRRWRRRSSARTGWLGGSANWGRGRRGGAGGWGRTGGGPRRPALPAAAILSSEEEEEEEEEAAAAAEAAARPARVSPGPGWWPRVLLSPTEVSWGRPGLGALTWAVPRALLPAPGFCTDWGRTPPPPFSHLPGYPGALRTDGFSLEEGDCLFSPVRGSDPRDRSGDLGARGALLTHPFLAWKPLSGCFVLLGLCSLASLQLLFYLRRCVCVCVCVCVCACVCVCVWWFGVGSCDSAK